MRKVTIIGAGNVGATIAYTLSVEGVANEIVIIDINKDKAEGEAIDIGQGGLFFQEDVKISSGDYEDAVDSDIVVITSGMARKPGMTRLDLAQKNVDILCSIAPQITKYAPNAVYVIVSNPVDVMTYVFHKITNIPENRIIGSGNSLDTARLRYWLANNCNISQQNVHAYVFGEHGDSSFVPLSQAAICSTPVADYYKHLTGKDIDQEAVEEYVRKSGGEIIKRKGATFYAVACATVDICKIIFSGVNTALSVSTLMHGEYGVDDVCLSTIAIVGKDGLKGTVPAVLTAEEEARLQHSAKCLRTVIDQITFQ